MKAKKKSKNYWAIVITGLITIACLCSCETVIDFKQPKIEDKLVIESYLMVGDTSIDVRVTRTGNPYNKKLRTFFNEDLYVYDADVRISFDGAPFDTLKLSKNFQDGTSGLLKPIYLIKKTVPEAKVCILKVKSNLLEVSSQIEIPTKTKLIDVTLNLIDTIRTKLWNSSIYTRYKYLITIDADFPQNSDNYYRFSINKKWIHNGKQYSSSLSEYEMFKFSDTSNKKKLTMIISDIIAPNTKMVFHLDHITKEYFEFRKALMDQNENLIDEINSEIIQIPTNINNGLGIFTVTNRDTLCKNY